MVDRRSSPENTAKTTRRGIQRLDFDPDTRFQEALRQRVDEYFRRTGRRERDCWQMYLKTAILLSCFAASYVLLILVATTLWQGLLLVAVLALCTAAIGFNIQHDGGHRAYSNHGWVNSVMAWTMHLIGGSSGHWRWKHTIIHHMYVNITGYDDDLDLGVLGRFSPHQRRLWHHRWQHLYLWAFYGLLAVKMQLVDDFRYVISGRLGPHRVPRPHGGEIVRFVLGKAVFLAWAFAIPMLLRPVWTVLFYYTVGAAVLGVVMVLVFVIPHLSANAEFPVPEPGEARMAVPWAEHQARVTVDFARSNPILTWLLGGLNYHKEHHLFPVICHVNYPGMSKVVEETCCEFGVPYRSYKSFTAGVAAHYRWLKQMGRPVDDAPSGDSVGP